MEPMRRDGGAWLGFWVVERCRGSRLLVEHWVKNTASFKFKLEFVNLFFTYFCFLEVKPMVKPIEVLHIATNPATFPRTCA